ncbi:MAG: hypothetical protein Q9212_006659 [Teloschistes hypoglaucus]
MPNAHARQPYPPLPFPLGLDLIHDAPAVVVYEEREDEGCDEAEHDAEFMREGRAGVEGYFGRLEARENLVVLLGDGNKVIANEPTTTLIADASNAAFSHPVVFDGAIQAKGSEKKQLRETLRGKWMYDQRAVQGRPNGVLKPWIDQRAGRRIGSFHMLVVEILRHRRGTEIYQSKFRSSMPRRRYGPLDSSDLLSQQRATPQTKLSARLNILLKQRRGCSKKIVLVLTGNGK